MLDPAHQPQTLEELLERHWKQGSRFLMEQASHFDIASLLSSLHQLKEENLRLEDYVYRLIAIARQVNLLAQHNLAEPRREQQVGNGPSSSNVRRLVSLVSPSRDKPLPSRIKSRSQDCELEKSVWIGKKYEETCSDRYLTGES